MKKEEPVRLGGKPNGWGVPRSAVVLFVLVEGKRKLENGLADGNAENKLFGFFVAFKPHRARGFRARSDFALAQRGVMNLAHSGKVDVVLGGIQLGGLRGH